MDLLLVILVVVEEIELVASNRTEEAFEEFVLFQKTTGFYFVP